MYPILMRLADRGLLETSWAAERGPARHLYRLTAAGREYATAHAVPLKPARAKLAARPRIARA
jgi:PadR family transcriptional regulator, regulatory protein PadR